MAKLYFAFGIAIIAWFLYNGYFGFRMFDIAAVSAAKHDPNARYYHK